MKNVFIRTGIAIVTASIVFAQTHNQTVPNTSEALADARRAIDKGNAQWSEGWKKGEPELVAALFADDGVQLAGNGKIFKGPQQISEHLKAAMQNVDPGVRVTVTTAIIWLDGDAAYETGKYKYEYKEKAKPAIDEGRYVTVWKRQKDGSWKLAMDMGLPEK